MDPQILDLLQSRGYCSVQELASHFDVSPSTVRRSLGRLDSMGLIQRLHGGAQVARVLDTPSTFKEVLHGEAKRQIGAMVATELGDRETIFLDSGSTTLEVARHLLGLPITIVTNDLRIGLEVADNSSTNLVVIGGELARSLHTLCGPPALTQVAQIRVDAGVFASDAISPAGMFNYSSRAIDVKQAAKKISKESYFVGDHTKFTRSALFKVMPIEGFVSGFTDSQTPDDLLGMFPVPINKAPQP